MRMKLTRARYTRYSFCGVCCRSFVDDICATVH